MKTRSSMKVEAANNKNQPDVLKNNDSGQSMHSPITSNGFGSTRRKRKHTAEGMAMNSMTATSLTTKNVDPVNSLAAAFPYSSSPNKGCPSNAFDKFLTPIAKGFTSPNPCGSEISFVNDSFLDAVENMEKKVGEEKNIGDSLCDDSFLKILDKMESGEKTKVVEDEMSDIFPPSPIAPKMEINSHANNVIPPKTEMNDVHRMSHKSSSSSFSKSNENPSALRAKVISKKQANKNPNKIKKKRKPKFKVAFTNRKSAKLLSESGQTQLYTGDLTIMSEDEKLQLSSWGLPKSVVARYKQKGVVSLFPWQLECLANPMVLEGANLLYSAPTSAGKTLVAEILMLKRVLELGKKAIMILPFVAVAREKMYSLQELFGDSGVRVEGFMGAHNPPGGFKAVDIAVCTIEKASNLINRLLEDSSLSQLGTIVVDEMHLIGDNKRGYFLEILITKILFVMKKLKCSNDNESYSEVSADETRICKNLNIQIIGMSATLPNLSDLAQWLNAELVTTDYRPVPLVERIKIGDKLYDKDLQLVRSLNEDSVDITIPGDEDGKVKLSLETVLGGHSVLIFCNTRALCETNATMIAKCFNVIGDPNNPNSSTVGEQLRKQLSLEKLKEVYSQLKECQGVDSNLLQCVCFGVAFHHAGLTSDERDILESAFKRCVVRVLVSTSTLSAGVNLPARRVIISSPFDYTGRNILNPLTYCQMVGRAGRKGVDVEGESILLTTSRTQSDGIRLIQSELNPVESALVKNGEKDGQPIEVRSSEGEGHTITQPLNRFILEALATKVATKHQELVQFSRCTLFSELISKNELDSCDIMSQSLKYLKKENYIRTFGEEGTENEEYLTSHLGMACLASSFAPEDGMFVFKELEKASQCFALDSELHIIYQVTPTYLSETLKKIDFNEFLKIYENLSKKDKRVAELVGISESFLIRASIGAASRENPAHTRQFLVHQRFFAALALSDLVNEVPIREVCAKYMLEKSVVQSLQLTASTFAGQVTAFCGRLGWSNMELLLDQFKDRMEFGVQRELLDLIRLPTLGGLKARVLYNGGIKTVADLAAAEPVQIEQILLNAERFQSNDRGSQLNSSLTKVSEDPLSVVIVNEARQFLQIALGLPKNMELWQKQSDDNNDSAKMLNTCISSENVDKVHDRESDATSTDEDSEIELEQSDETHTDSVKKTYSQPELMELMESQQKMISGLTISKVEALPVSTFDDSSDDIFANVEEPDNKTHESKKSNIIQEIKTSNKNCLNVRSVSNQTNQEKLYPEMPLPKQLLESSIPKLYKEPCLEEVKSKCEDEPKILCDALNISEEEMEIFQESPNKDFPQINEKRLSLIDFDMEFDSIASLMEVSLNVSKTEDVTENKKDEIDSKTVNVHKITETQAEAMLAIAEDTNFESEDMFATENDEKENVNKSNDSCTSNEVFDVSSEIDEAPFGVTMKRTSLMKTPLRNQRIKNETFSAATKSPNILVRKIETQPISVFSEKIAGKIITVKKITAVKSLPDDLFKFDCILGMGIKLSPAKLPVSKSRGGIGARIIGRSIQSMGSKGMNPEDEGVNKHTITLFNGSDTIWLYECRHGENCFSKDGMIQTSPLDFKRGEEIEHLFERIQKSNCSIVLLDGKDKVKQLLKYCGNKILSKLPLPNKVWDPKIAQWLWRFEDESWNISTDKLISTHIEGDHRKVLQLNWGQEIKDAYIAFKLMVSLQAKLMDSSLWNHFTDIEMPSSRFLMLMELNGMQMDSSELNRLKTLLQFKSSILELKAFQQAKRQFNLGSSKELSQILFNEIGLKRPKNTKGTGKDVLALLDHELPRVIAEWRKITNTLQTVIYPFQQETNSKTGRIYGIYSHFTVTGRVIMSEPSLQCIPRDFDVQLDFTEKQIDDLKNHSRLQFGNKLASLMRNIENGIRFYSHIKSTAKGGDNMISMRNAFVSCSEDFIMVSADYSQLELRILAHMCRDKNLMKILNDKQGDVFIALAAEWKKIPSNKVSASVRQEFKGLVYGIIYGMGPKTLGDQMGVEEAQARIYIRDFMQAYPGVRSFLDKTIKTCRESGYIETICGRKRYLPLINSLNSIEKSQAERQAVNSRIQGSAADLVKTAMTKIQNRFNQIFPYSLTPLDWNSFSSSGNSKPPVISSEIVCFPILNLHDELIFEVRYCHLDQVVHEIRNIMQSCLKLSVRFPVVVKSGKSWGSLQPIV